jgi:hypothetical protein
LAIRRLGRVVLMEKRSATSKSWGWRLETPRLNDTNKMRIIAKL